MLLYNSNSLYRPQRSSIKVDGLLNILLPNPHTYLRGSNHHFYNHQINLSYLSFNTLFYYDILNLNPLVQYNYMLSHTYIANIFNIKKCHFLSIFLLYNKCLYNKIFSDREYISVIDYNIVRNYTIGNALFSSKQSGDNML